MGSISYWQLYCLMLLFQLGTSVVFGFASPAKQDAWITVLLSMVPGSLLLWSYSKLFEADPQSNWTQILKNTFGKAAGFMLGTFYVFIFIYSAARDLRDLGELTKTFLLPNTPMLVTMLLFQLLVATICYAGMERMGRIAELNAPVIFLFFALQIVLLLGSGQLQPHLLTPVAEKWKPILVSVFPGNYTVPYAESFAFAAFWSIAGKPKQFKKAILYSATTVSGFLIVLDLLAVCTVGPEVFSRSFFPLMTIFHLVNIGDFIQNIDPVIVTNYMIGVLLKVSVFTFAALSTISDLWKIEGHKVAALPISLLILLFALFMAKDLSSHLFTGREWVPWVIFLPFFVAVPMVTLPVTKLRSLRRRK